MIFVTHSIHEAVFLSSRVVMMAARPGRVVEEFRIDEPYPRSADFMVSPQFSRYAKQLQDSLLRASRRAPTRSAARMTRRRTAPRPCCSSRACSACSYPLLVGVVLVALWQALVTGLELPPYLVPSPLPDDADAGHRLGAAGHARCWSR